MRINNSRVAVGALWYCRNWEVVKIQSIADDGRSIIGSTNKAGTELETGYWWDDRGRHGGGYGLPEWDLMLALEPVGKAALVVLALRFCCFFLIGAAAAVMARQLLGL